MDAAVDPSEPITRFLRNSNHMRPSLGRPHFSGFLPRDPAGEISVYRSIGLDDPAIRSPGADYVAKPDAPLKGYCILVADGFYREGLTILPDTTAHERHANVSGWTGEPRNRIVAKKLADAAVLICY